MIAEAIVLAAMVCAGVFAARSKDLLAAAVALGIVSLLVSVQMYLLQAPDVALAEAAVGAALTTAIMVYAIRATRRDEE